ncbi:MAG TPA: DUF952 domain-containing protein [Streptosporangiaceae bacterium]|nr:DUF952 domain-containing protein [Streptosporangiaceae bacterium]
MTELPHITGRTDWEAARRAGSYRISTRGVSLDQQGFIQCSHPRQLRGVAEANYANAVCRDAAGRLILPDNAR